jgi:hypothetical protein
MGFSAAAGQGHKRHGRSHTRDQLEPWRSVKLCPFDWRRHKIQKAAGQNADRLTDLLTRRAGTGKVTRDTGDAQRGLRLVSETHENAGDEGDVRPSAHNPATIASVWSRRVRDQNESATTSRKTGQRRITRGSRAGCARASCTDGTGNRTGGTSGAGIIRRPRSMNRSTAQAPASRDTCYGA